MTIFTDQDLSLTLSSLVHRLANDSNIITQTATEESLTAFEKDSSSDSSRVLYLGDNATFCSIVEDKFGGITLSTNEFEFLSATFNANGGGDHLKNQVGNLPNPNIKVRRTVHKLKRVLKWNIKINDFFGSPK